MHLSSANPFDLIRIFVYLSFLYSTLCFYLSFLLLFCSFLYCVCVLYVQCAQTAEMRSLFLSVTICSSAIIESTLKHKIIINASRTFSLHDFLIVYYRNGSVQSRRICLVCVASPQSQSERCNH